MALVYSYDPKQDKEISARTELQLDSTRRTSSKRPDAHFRDIDMDDADREFWEWYSRTNKEMK